MAENHENPLDLPTEQSVKAELSRLPTWEEWLQKKGFLKGRGTQRWAYGDDEWNREWKNQGRGWAVRVYPERHTVEVSVYSNPLRYGKPSFKFEASERGIPKLVGKIVREIERPVSDQSKKRRLKALELKTPKEPREDDVPLEKLVLPEAGPIRRPIPDDPSELSPEQMGQMLSRVRVRCFQPGTRVRVRTERQTRLNGLMGTVVDAGPHSCYVALDDYVQAGDDDPFRFEEQELEPIYPQQEAEDVDAPLPYLDALDWFTTLKSLGYKLLAGSYRKSINLPSDKGYLRIMVEPDEKIPAASIYIEYRSQAEGETERIQDIVVPAIEVVDTVREIEALVDHKDVYGITDFARQLQAKNYPGTPIPPLGHLMYLFGESALEPDDVDNPEPYFQELQRHGEVINALRNRGVRMRRRFSAKHPYYALFWIPNAVTEVSYDIYLEPDGTGWSVSAEGLKTFQHDVYGDFQEEFDIDRTWTIPAGASADELEGEVDNILSDLSKYQGPDEPTVHGPDVDDIDENVDDIDYEQYAKDSANYNIVSLITSKDLRKIVRELGFKVNTLYRSRITQGWSLSATPATAQAFEVFQQNPYKMAEFLGHELRQGLIKRFPELGKITQGQYVFDQKLDLHCWEWSGATSADPSNPNNWVLYADVRPIDWAKRGRGGKMLEGVDDPDELDVTKYAKESGDAVKAIEQAGYTYGFDRVGRERWNKFWPLPKPLRHEKPWSPIWTKFWGSPDPFGQYVYGIQSEDHVNATAGGYIVVRPVKAPAHPEGWDYATSVRRVLLKVENMVREMPKDTTDIDVMRNYVFTAMERIKNEVNAEADATSVDEAADPDDPQAFIDRARAAKMGDTVEVKCPRCGTAKLLGKNWPDDFKGWGTTCDQCGTFLPLGGEVVVDSVQDPDDPSAVLATHQPRVYALYGQYADYDAPVSFSTFTTLDQAVARARERELHAEYEHVWADELEAKDLSRWDSGETMAVRYTGVKFIIAPDYEVKRIEQPADPLGYVRPPNPMHESADFQDIDDPSHYVRTTFDPVAFLQSAGWKKLKSEAWEYWYKDFPLPQIYHLGGMAFTKFRVTVGFDERYRGAFAAMVNVYWINDEGSGLPVKGWNLEPQLLRPQSPEAEDIADSDLDYNMPIRRFVLGVGDVLANLKYPPGETAVLVLNTNLEAEMGRFVRELNQRADRPANPVRESVDPDAPEPYVRSLGTVDHVMQMHGMSKIYRDEQEGGWLRTFKLPRAAITHINDKPDDPLVAMSGKVDELRLVVGYKVVPDPSYSGLTILLHDVRMFVRVPQGENSQILWGTSEVFKSEHEAARSLNEALNYAIMSLENNHPTDVTELTTLRQILQMGVGPFLRREVGESQDVDDPSSVLQSHPGFEYRHTQHMGDMVFVKGPGEDTSDWPRDIGRVVEGPDNRWYVIGVRGVPPEQLDRYGFGIRGERLRTFATEDDAALAIWLIWSRLDKKRREGYLLQ